MTVNSIIIICVALFITTVCISQDDEYCTLDNKIACQAAESHNDDYLLFYDVNFYEGFNLKRDVYLRLAVMIDKLNKSNPTAKWSIVLPPWYLLYHWRQNVSPIPWSEFFNIDSMRSYIPVKDLSEVFNALKEKKLSIDKLFVLNNFPPVGNEELQEKWEVTDFESCNYDGEFWGYNNVTAKSKSCVSFLGRATSLVEVFTSQAGDAKMIMIGNAERVLHDDFGSADYWSARKSMKFNSKLIDIADKYIQKTFGCGTPRCDNYLGVHWRRQDYVVVRKNHIASIKGTASQLLKKLQSMNGTITKVFIATDADYAEWKSLEQQFVLADIEAHRFMPSEDVKREIKEGGIAIVDQIICARAALFVGTYESTFTFRIQEEREIMGFPSDTSYNILCPDRGPCPVPSVWKFQQSHHKMLQL